MVSSDVAAATGSSFDINKFEDLLSRLEASKRRQMSNLGATQKEAQEEPMSTIIS